jgi:transcriptional regulator GlxA family with amidase domain
VSVPINNLSPAQLNDNHSLHRQETPGDKRPLFNGPRNRDRRVELILMLLEESPERQWELADLIKVVNLSGSRLAHLFKNEIGVSIPQYLTQIRLTKAKHELDSGFLSIKEIAASVGFRNVTRFTANFKSAIGTTPAEYRRRPAVTLSRKDLAIARSANR